MSKQVIELIQKLKLSDDDYLQIIHHFAKTTKNSNIRVCCEEITYDCLIEYVHKYDNYLSQFAIKIDPYFDRLGYHIQQHIVLVMEDFMCSMSFNGDNEGSGSYNLKIFLNNKQILTFMDNDIFSFDNECIEKCKKYNNDKLQILIDDYGYDDITLFVNDIVLLFNKLLCDNDIVINSKNNALEHFS